MLKNCIEFEQSLPATLNNRNLNYVLQNRSCYLHDDLDCAACVSSWLNFGQAAAEVIEKEEIVNFVGRLQGFWSIRTTDREEEIDLVASQWKLRIPSEKNRPFSDTTLTRLSPWKYFSKTSAWTHHPTQCKNQDDHQFSSSCRPNLKTYIRSVIVYKDIHSKTEMLFIVDWFEVILECITLEFLW